MLDHFRKAQEQPVQALLALKAKGRMPDPYTGYRPSFSDSLRQKGPGAVIAEYKRASPSAGDINLKTSPEEAARMYAKAGAAALSVLTEQTHFKGDMAFLSRMSDPGLPLLRKDFLVHLIQVEETAASPAAALLLIARMLPQEDLASMLRATYATGLEAVVEIFDQNDLDKARFALRTSKIEPAIIQVNNRNLKTLAVSDTPSRLLIRKKQDGEIWISASGVRSREEVLERAWLGFDAVLVGTSLMQGTCPGLLCDKTESLSQ